MGRALQEGMKIETKKKAGVGGQRTICRCMGWCVGWCVGWLPEARRGQWAYLHTLKC